VRVLSRETIGAIGEIIVDHFLEDASRTDDWYDQDKDGTIGSQSYEVKTFRLNFKTQGFWVDESQWRKVDEVDNLFFVRVPESKTEAAKLYLCEDHKNPEVYEETKTNGGRPVRSYHLKYCREIAVIPEDVSNILYEKSVGISKWSRFSQDKGEANE
jgi:hypothetical protein